MKISCVQLKCRLGSTRRFTITPLSQHFSSNSNGHFFIKLCLRSMKPLPLTLRCRWHRCAMKGCKNWCNDMTSVSTVVQTVSKSGALCEHQMAKYRVCNIFFGFFNPLTPSDHYSGRTALLTSKRCILYIYSTNIGTEYFKHGIYPPFFPLQNTVCFIILTYLVPVLFTFYIQVC